MGAYRDIYVKKIFSSVTVAASGSAISSAIDLGGLSTTGHFSLQIELTGNGTAKVEFLLSNNGVDFMEPTGSADIVTGFTKTSGPGSDGKSLISFGPILGRQIQIKLTETGTSNSIVVSAWLAMS